MEKIEKIIIKKSLREENQLISLLKSMTLLMISKLIHKRKTLKNNKAKFQIIKMIRNEIEKTIQ